MRGRIDGAGLQPKAHRSTTPRSSDYLLSACDKCLSSFWFTVQLHRVHAGWGPQRYVNTQWSTHHPQLFSSRVVVSGGGLQEHSVVKFHFTLCVSIDFYWSLDKISQDIVKRPSPLCTHFHEKGTNRVKKCVCVFFPCKCGYVGWLSKCSYLCVCFVSLPLLLEAWVSASFGVRKRSGSLSGLVPVMLMDWTCTM